MEDRIDTAPTDNSPYQLFMLVFCVWALLVLGTETFFRWSDSTRAIFDYADNVVCGLFFVDFLNTFFRAPRKLWWAVSTMTTVGYGDRYPVTSEGRIVAIFLMAVGVGVFGTMSGLVASWFLSPAEEADSELAEIKAMLLEIRATRQAGEVAERDSTASTLPG